MNECKKYNDLGAFPSSTTITSGCYLVLLLLLVVVILKALYSNVCISHELVRIIVINCNEHISVDYNGVIKISRVGPVIKGRHNSITAGDAHI